MSRNKVLVVDDESGVRFGIRDFLEQHGYEIEEAESCQDAQHLFRTSRPDIVIADYMMPDGTALDLLPRLREIDAGIPLLVLTAHGSIDLAVRAIKEGAEQFLTKPLELPTLLVILQTTASETAQPSQTTRQQVAAGSSGNRSVHRYQCSHSCARRSGAKDSVDRKSGVDSG